VDDAGNFGNGDRGHPRLLCLRPFASGAIQ
jgi:hypothetical protein